MSEGMGEVPSLLVIAARKPKQRTSCGESRFGKCSYEHPEPDVPKKEVY